VIPSINKSFIKAQIDAVRSTIGREVSVFTTENVACTQCTVSGYYDSINDNSWFQVCPECSGQYWKPTEIETKVLSRVHWVSNEAITATAGGKYFLGEAHITVDPSYTELLQASQSNQGRHVLVDGQDMEIIRINPLGAPEINRVRAILKGVGTRPDNG
jgi:hypothetical protein